MPMWCWLNSRVIPLRCLLAKVAQIPQQSIVAVVIWQVNEQRSAFWLTITVYSHTYWNTQMLHMSGHIWNNRFNTSPIWGVLMDLVLVIRTRCSSTNMSYCFMRKLRSCWTIYMQYACIGDFTSTKYHSTSLLSLNISSHPKCLPSAMLLLAMSVVPSLLAGVSKRLLQMLLLGMLSHQANNPLALKGRIEIKK